VIVSEGRTAVTEYKIVEWDPNTLWGKTRAESVVELLNANAAEGWELDRFEDLSDGKRLFYLKRAKSN
jgi:hypothetical protein